MNLSNFWNIYLSINMTLGWPLNGQWTSVKIKILQSRDVRVREDDKYKYSMFNNAYH